MPKHDSLHLDDENRSLGMTACWCTCPSCWHNEGTVKKKSKGDVVHVPKGRCICPDCPCHDFFPMSLINVPFLIRGRGAERTGRRA